MNANLKKLTASLQLDEGLRLTVYDDATSLPIKPGTTVQGHPTIGYGRALDTNGITQAEAYALLADDVTSVVYEVSTNLPWVDQLDDVRTRVLLEMAFNMGIDGLLEFHDTLRHVQAGQYNLASVSMMDSQWADQVGERAVVLSTMMRTGTDPV